MFIAITLQQKPDTFADVPLPRGSLTYGYGNFQKRIDIIYHLPTFT